MNAPMTVFTAKLHVADIEERKQDVRNQRVGVVLHDKGDAEHPNGAYVETTETSAQLIQKIKNTRSRKPNM